MHVKEVGKSSMLHNIYSTIVSFLTEQEKLQKKKKFREFFTTVSHVSFANGM